MKKVVFLTVALLLAASMAFAQAGSIGIFSDTGGTDCSLVDMSPALMAVHVVYVNHVGATAVQYAAPQPACMLGATWLSDTGIFPINLGNSQTGVSTGFGGCYFAPTHVLIISYFGVGASQACCYYPVIPHPLSASGLIEAADCAFLTIYPTGGEGIINPNGSCQCDVPAQETTWGKVKSLYSE